MTTAATHRGQWCIIGISGVTCGGKTTLANKLKDSLTPVYVFHQDKYFYPDDSPKHIKCAGLDHNNYDVLSSLDMERMYADIVETLRGGGGGGGTKYMVVEGFTVLNYKPILEICNLRYYLVLEYGECVTRRCYRLYEPPDVAGYFEQCVWPEHLKYRAEIEKDKRVTIVDGTQPDALDIVMADVRALS